MGLNSVLCGRADRCRSSIAQDDSTTELDGGAGYKKPPRKARKKLLPSQDSILHSRHDVK